MSELVTLLLIWSPSQVDVVLGCRYKEFDEDQDKLLAYILIETKGSSEKLVGERLRGLGEVIEAASVYGQFDAVAKVAVADFIHLKKFVNKDLGKDIRDIDRTVTFPVHGREGYYWNKGVEAGQKGVFAHPSQYGVRHRCEEIGKNPNKLQL